MKQWTELRTPYLVAKLRTVSAAAEVLEIHRATVIRHIDAIEAALGTKIFQRHARGYTPTEVGADLLRVGERTQSAFDGFLGRTRLGLTSVGGTIVVTSLAFVATTVMPRFADFQRRFPECVIDFHASSAIVKLEHGEADVAIRVGREPRDLDYIVQPLPPVLVGLYGHEAYLERHGTPMSIAALGEHRLIGFNASESRLAVSCWLTRHVPEAAIAMRVSNPLVTLEAVLAGIGIGLLLEQDASRHAELVPVLQDNASWSVPLWLVTHVDVHRTPKIQALLDFLKMPAEPSA